MLTIATRCGFSQHLSATLSRYCIESTKRLRIAVTVLQGFCKGLLWPLLHYVTPEQAEFGQLWDAMWQAYVAANMMVCRVVHDERC